MKFYNKHILPFLIDTACRSSAANAQREKVIPIAKGNVLEIGIGTGLNIPFYERSQIKSLIGIEPSIDIWNKHTGDIDKLDFKVDIFHQSAENIPCDNHSIDSVVFTYTMCSIDNVDRVFEEIRRVLKANAQIIFCEHGKAPDQFVRKTQSMINPIWKQFSGGCHLNKDIKSILKKNGFDTSEMHESYIPGWRPASFNYFGTAKQR